ncbi:MAG: Cell-wall biogenesis glycosyltransferase [Candidatus Moranbacteria bacterium GW2011_GWE1_35_17]|nr:MAG: Cell-wall biogenesis glycosyltransferase [Candidatus Moranbacteria bacterium GW2011_GWE1_35_17]KKP81847.1 MAG: Cell-wall biogenesis glycosyltransferase [Candidatus Moranbacteria bacterium GW2011_GWF1_35_5]KKP82785.1 MAG: Cell-wall biogenesis glycosyltransferase [Candidatus Moranbacteria bacterium GW2011_GWF2_35_54]
MDKKISIIIPVYNAQKTIAKCLNSILGNSFYDYEILLINDGSSDGSQKILESYLDKFPDKIRVFEQENQGVAKARNLGILLSQGEYIVFIDNDDFIDKEYLKIFAEAISAGDLDLVLGGYRRTTLEKVLYEMRLASTEWSKYMIMAPWAKIYKKDFLVKNKIEFLDNNIGEDVYFNLLAVNLSDKISIINYCGYNWFYNLQSVSNAKQKEMKNNLNVKKLLEASHGRLLEMGVSNKKEVEFYFIRYIIWYLLYTGRKSAYHQVSQEFGSLFNWLKVKYPKFEKNYGISLFSPEGETLRNRLIVYIFMGLYRLRLIRLFFRGYAVF